MSVIVLASLPLCPAWVQGVQAQMKIHVMDVGRADSILLEFKKTAGC